MAWNARLLLALSVFAAAGENAHAQVMPDDHPESAAAAPLAVGTTLGRFDYRVPRSPDLDGFRFVGEPGHIYHFRVDVDHPAPDQARVASYNTLPQQWFDGVWGAQLVLPGPGGDAYLGAQPSGTLIVLAGLAQPDGSSVPYRLVVDDLGPSSDQPMTPDNTPSVAVGEWYRGELTASTVIASDARNDYDVFTVPTLAGHRYTVECEAIDLNGGQIGAAIVGYTDADDPRLGRYSLSNGLGYSVDHLDTLVDGTLAVQVAGMIARIDQTLHYRVRLVDAGPAQFDDHAGWASGATPIQVGVPVEFTLNDPPWTAPYSGDDIDCFRVDLAAGHAYRIGRKPAHGSITPYAFNEMAVCAGLSNEPLAQAWSFYPVIFKPAVSGPYTIRCGGSHQLTRLELLVQDLGAVTDDYPDQPLPDAPAAGPGTISGVIDDADDVDYIKLNAPPGSIVTATLRSDDGTWLPIAAYLYVRGSSYITTAGVLAGVESTTHTAPPPRSVAVPGLGGDQTLAYLQVMWPGSFADVPPPRAYTIDIQIAPPDPADDWPDTSQGATLIAPGEPSRWALPQHDGDVDVFLADLTAGHVYQIASSPSVSPLDRPTDFAGSDPNQPVGMFQPSRTTRYQLVYPVDLSGPSEVSIVDMGPVSDDFPPVETMRKFEAGVPVHGRIDFNGDADSWLVQPQEPGIYEVELTARPTVVVTAGTANGAQPQVSTEDYSYPSDDSERTVVAQFPVIDNFGVMPQINVTAWGYFGPQASGYTATVRLVQPFRGARPGETPDTALDIAPGEWAAAVVVHNYEVFWYRVPVIAGHLYRTESSDPDFRGQGQSVNVVEPSGTPVVENGTCWVARESGPALVNITAGTWWFRFRVRDMGPAVDDHQASWEAATPLELGQQISGVLDSADDVDTFRLPLQAGASYAALLQWDGDSGIDTLEWSWIDPRSPDFPSQWQGWPAGFSTMTFSPQQGWSSAQAGCFSVRIYPYGAPFSAPVPYTLRVLPVCPADIAGTGASVGPDGLVDNNDFIVFINLFFMQRPSADIGRDGGFEGPDDRLDNNDFIVYINRFFAGCP